MTTETYGKCPHCKTGDIIGEVANIPRYDTMNMPFGPISERNYRLEVSFYCSKCGTKFQFPPDSTDAAKHLLKKERDRIVKVQRTW